MPKNPPDDRFRYAVLDELIKMHGMERISYCKVGRDGKTVEVSTFGYSEKTLSFVLVVLIGVLGRNGGLRRTVDLNILHDTPALVAEEIEQRMR